MVDSLDAQRALVVITEGEPWKVACHHQLPGDVLGEAGLVSRELLGTVYRSGEPLLMGRPEDHEELGDRVSLLLAGTATAVCVPILDPQRKVVALLYADRLDQQKTWKYSDMGRLLQQAQKTARILFPSAPAAVRPVRPRPRPSAPDPVEAELGPATPQGLVLFYRSLSVMLRSGVSLVAALDLLAAQTEDPVIAAASEKLSRGIQGGHRCSVVMAREPRVFSVFATKMMAVGEMSGGLHRVLERLADYETQKLALTLKIRSSLTYPAFLLAACCLMLVLVPPLVLEGHFEFLLSSGVEPPWLTLLVMKLSQKLRSPIFMGVLLLLLAASSFVLTRLWRDPGGRETIIALAHGWPHLGWLLNTLALARFSRALAVQTECGVSLLEALPLAAAASDHPFFEQALERVTARLQEGESLSEAMETEPVLPRQFVEMVRAGEESGKLPLLLDYNGRLQENSLNHALEVFTALLEPLIMGVMGSFVAVMLLATMLPLVKLLEKL